MDPIRDDLEGLDEATKAFYTEKDGKHVLDVAKYAAAQVEAATGGLKAKVDELLGEKKAQQAKAEEAAEEARKAAEEAARKKGDVEALEASWQAKLDKVQTDAAEREKGLRASVESLTVGRAATEIAAEMAVKGSANVLERFVRDRLTVETGEEGPKVRVLDEAGKASAATLDDLKTELAANPALAPLIAASKATGGGAAGANGGTGGASTTGNMGGTREERRAAIAARFPDLKSM